MTKKFTNWATKYAKAVLSGKIIAGPHVRNSCQRHLDDMKRKDIYFDLEAADRVIRFFEQRLRLSDGQFEGKPFKLHLAQKFILSSIYGWKKPDGFRRFRRAYLEIGKGNGKSPLAGGIGLFGLMADREPGAQIYAAASKKDQAEILFRDACNMVRKSPEINRRLHISGSEGSETNLAYLRKGSFFRPISKGFEESGAGPRPHYALADEVHEMKSGLALEQLERGFKFRRQPLLFMITNSGSDRNSVCWIEHERAIHVAAGNTDANDQDAPYIGDLVDDSHFSYVCALDVDDDPLEDPSCWIKANPLLGTILTEEYLAGVAKQARDMPSKMNGILRLHFCQWTDAAKAWMPLKEIQPLLRAYDPKEENPRDVHSDKRAFIGLDLSEAKDLTAKAVVVQTGTVQVKLKDGTKKTKPTYEAWVEAWTPLDSLDTRAKRDKKPYRKWLNEGFLTALPGKRVSFLDVAQSLQEDDHDFQVIMAAYDRYAFRRLEDSCDEVGLIMDFIEHPQGGIKKGKPNQAMIDAAKMEDKDKKAEGLWMPGSVSLLEELIAEKRIKFWKNPVLLSAIAAAVPEEDRWGNYWLAKTKSLNKIDAVIALCMAVGAAVSMEAVSSEGLDDWIESLR